MRQARVGLARMGGIAGARVPERLLIAPRNLRTSDPVVATDIESGHFPLAGRVLDVRGESPFEMSDLPPAVLAELHGFGWLRHLRAAETTTTRETARALVGSWMDTSHQRARGPAATPAVAARRVISWIAEAPLLLQAADAEFYHEFMRVLAGEAQALEMQLAGLPRHEVRLQVLIALTTMGASAVGQEAHGRRFAQALANELDAQILADGGHVSRSPALLLDLLLDLLPLRQALSIRRIQPPQGLITAIDRMLPMLRGLRHGDGSIALFNGMGATTLADVAGLFVYDEQGAAPIANAPYSGYQRLAAGAATVIVDAGAPPRGPASRHAFAGTLAFELSSGMQKLVSNCGAPQLWRGELVPFAAATAAHSTLCIGDHSSAHLAMQTDEATGSPLRIVLDGPRQVHAQRSEDAGGLGLAAQHDGYAASHGLLHRRELRLSADGEQLYGADALLPAAAGVLARWRQPRRGVEEQADLRFHLHPGVMAHALDAHTIGLAAPRGEVWGFACDDAEVRVEESVLFASAGGQSATAQLVLSMPAVPGQELRWRFWRAG
jgi:uncharacterized heparinase superfamily protein